MNSWWGCLIEGAIGELYPLLGRKSAACSLQPIACMCGLQPGLKTGLFTRSISCTSTLRRTLQWSLNFKSEHNQYIYSFMQVYLPMKCWYSRINVGYVQCSWFFLHRALHGPFGALPFPSFFAGVLGALSYASSKGMTESLRFWFINCFALTDNINVSSPLTETRSSRPLFTK